MYITPNEQTIPSAKKRKKSHIQSDKIYELRAQWLITWTNVGKTIKFFFFSLFTFG